ncbi:hypothetical protein [Rhodoferax sp. U11-2br]|uniref:hypothetical protein n=1 Tax=Rhodoferax sp. U11-2br TaxID=2838878 RepID=UPI001BEBF57C|nr:hypothetical protein [Rhodoferax sp. U11-2br]MBT3067905.1 hypothetical protein [Rhodoferax sp. U11-2br]
MGQTWGVVVLVGLAALYCLWYVLPNPLRQRLGRLHRALGRAPSCRSDCGRCGQCPGSAAPTQAPQERTVSFHPKH